MEFDATSTIQPRHGSTDYYLFSYLKLHLYATIFHSNDEVIKEVDSFLDSRTPQFFAEGIEKLPNCWQTIVDLNGDYILISFADLACIHHFTRLNFLTENTLLNVIVIHCAVLNRLHLIKSSFHFTKCRTRKEIWF